MPILKDENLEMVEGRNGRWYIIDGVYKPSMTTVLGSSYKGKKTGSTSSADIGTVVHHKILKRYKRMDGPHRNIQIPRDETMSRIHRCMRMWNNLELDIKPLHVETVVHSYNPLVAGRIDVDCLLDGVRTVLDIKTGKKYPYHPMQGAGYVMCLDDDPSTIDNPVEQAAFVYLDAWLDTNPEQLGEVVLYDREDIARYTEDFKDAYVGFEWPKFALKKKVVKRGKS